MTLTLKDLVAEGDRLAQEQDFINQHKLSEVCTDCMAADSMTELCCAWPPLRRIRQMQVPCLHFGADFAEKTISTVSSWLSLCRST